MAIDQDAFIRLESTILQWSEVAAIVLDEGDTTKATVTLKSGERLHFEGFEAAELWKTFDPESDWRKS